MNKSFTTIFIALLAVTLINVGADNIYIQLPPDEIADISIAPVLTFRESCSSCHGEEGKYYSPILVKMKDNEIKKRVEEMMFDNAFLNPNKIEIEAMYAYVKSIKEKKPYASVINSKSFLEGKDKSLRIDVSPNTKISADSKIKIEKEKNIWKLSYDSKKIKQLKITLTQNDVSSSFVFPEEIWSK